jgi:hypothetical protein
MDFVEQQSVDGRVLMIVEQSQPHKIVVAGNHALLFEMSPDKPGSK